MNYQKVEKQQLSIEANRGDCAVKALSIVCDVPYAVAHKTLERLGRVSGMGTPKHLTYDAILMLGYKMAPITTQAKTIKQLEEVPELKKGYYSIRVRGHRLAMVNGVVEDWTRGRRHRIIEVLRVTSAVSRKERKQRIKAIMGA